MYTCPSSANLWHILVLSAQHTEPSPVVKDAQLECGGPAVTLKMCHWISMRASAFSLEQSPTDTLRAASHVQDSQRSRLHGAVS